MARGCYNIQSLHSHRQTHTGTMKSFALVLGRCDITYVDWCVTWRVWSEERLGSSSNSVRSDLHTKWSQVTNNPTMSRYYYWRKVIFGPAMWIINVFGFIWYVLSCIKNVSPSKSWTLRSQKNDCYPICWQSVRDFLVIICEARSFLGLCWWV